MAGTTYKQCGCRDEDGRRLGQQCPKLRRADGAWSRDHGTWYYQLELPPHPGGTRRAPLRRGGFTSHTAARHELDRARELLAIPEPHDTQTRTRIADAIVRSAKTTRQLPELAAVRKMARTGHDLTDPPTVGEWLDQWLAGKKLREGTARSYHAHVRLYYKPHIGHIRIDRLRVADVASVFEAIDEQNDTITAARASGDPELRANVKGRRTVGPATQQRIRATLRSALATFGKHHPGLLDINAAALAELPPGKRPKALVWTAERARAWHDGFHTRLAAARARAGGKRVDVLAVYIATPRPSPVMVWTPAQTRAFLERARRHRLYALYHLIAFRGLRRGEACGLRRTDTDLATAVTSIRWQITQLGWATSHGTPKSDAGERHIALDTQTLTVLRAHRRQQAKEKAAAGHGWAGTGFEFTNPDGTPLHPAAVTGQFEQLAYLAGLPPIRLHDLRHFAATLHLAAGVDVKIVQDMLGHSSRAITSDTYESVLPDVARTAAEAAAALLPVTQTA